MKIRNIVRMFLCASACLLVACTQDTAALYGGDYTYKTSGTVEVTYNQTSYERSLTPEVGQMDIVKMDDGSLLIVRSALQGNIYTTYADVDGDSLLLRPFTRRVSVINTNNINVDAEVTVSGSAVLRGDDMVIFTETYSGETVNGTDIITIAKRN